MKSIVELWTPVLINDGAFKDNYIVSNMGRVKQKRIYKDGSYQFVLMKIIDSARPVVKLNDGEHVYKKSVAKLVLASFHYREGCECANITYLDGNMKNCELANLRYTADKQVYEDIKTENEQASTRKYVRHKPVGRAKFLMTKQSCKLCAKYPCFSGMENLSSDFAAQGCRKYELKQSN